MDCDACAKMIELDLEDQGINATCNYAKGILEAELKNDKEEEKLKVVVKSGGYDIS